MSALPPIADIHRPYGEAGAVRQRFVRRDCGTHHEFASRLRQKHERKFGSEPEAQKMTLDQRPDAPARQRFKIAKISVF